MGVCFWIWAILALASIIDLVMLSLVIFRGNAADITEYMCYFFYILGPVPLRWGIVIRFAEAGVAACFLIHYII